MRNPFRLHCWSPYLVGAGIGMLSWFAFWSADQPLGISTAFEHSAAIAERLAAPQVAKNNAYFADKAREGKPPKIGWEWMLVVGVFVGAFVSTRLSGDTTHAAVPGPWAARFGPRAAIRFLAAFFGGALMMFGARMAGGCTSGHGISGAQQFAFSSWIFFPTFFAAAVLAAFFLYGRKGADHV